MKKDIKLKGQLKLYMQWPGIMILFLILMNIWIFRMDRKAGLLMSAFVLVYAVVIGIMYFYNKSLILADMVEFAAQYGIVQNTLLKELSIPYAILLDDGKIIWTNTQFREVLGTTIRKDTYLSKYIPELNRGVFPKEENESVSLEFNYLDRDYQAEIQCVSVEGFSETEQLLEIPEEKEYFIAIHLQDVTELNRYIRANEEQRLVAGLVYIDNYEEVMESVEEVRQSLLVALIDRKINQYIADFSGIVKKLEKDKYFVVIKKESFNRMEKDRFSLHDEVKGVSIGNQIPVTLSIGLGLSTDTYAAGYNYARIAIDLALARGGDQAVVKTKDQITYYGGKTQQMEKNTRVKARVKAQAFRELVETKDKVVVMGHKMPDADAFGSAVAIYRAAKTLNKKAYIVVNEATSAMRPMMEAFAEANNHEQGIVIGSSQAKEIVDRNTVVVVVDTNKPSYTECEEILAMTPTVVVFDHHRRGNEVIQHAALSYVETNASSSCEMVAEILQYFADNVRLKGGEADCIYAGIMIDTDNFMRKTGVRTFEAAAFLRRCGADVTRVHKMFRTDMAEYKARAEAVRHAEVYKGFALTVCPSKGLASPTIVGAQAANELLNIVGVRASIVLTEYNGRIYVSARSIDDVNVQVIMEKMGGGGHLNMAGVQLECTLEEAMQQVRDTLDCMFEKGELE